MRRLILATVMFLLVPGMASAGGGGGSICPGFASGTTISMLDSCFNGTAHFAPTGMALTIRNDGEFPHTFTAIDGTFDSGQIQPGETYQLTIDEAGVFEVFCTLHGTAEGGGMAGVLIVGEPVPQSFAATLNADVIREAVSEKDQVVVTALDRHSRTIQSLSASQDSLKQAIDTQMTTGDDAVDEAAAISGIQVEPASDGIWVPMMSGLAVGLALAALLVARRPQRRFELRDAREDLQPSLSP